MIDLHTHTWRCGHARGTASDYVLAAAERGIKTIAITDHLPLPPSVLTVDPAAAQYAMPEADLATYVAEVIESREQASRAGGPDVLLGIEADLFPGNESYVRELLTRHPFDVVLGSVHFVDGWAFDDPDRLGEYASWDVRELWERYFADLTAAASSGLADVIGHADLVKKFGYVPEGDLTDLYAEVADAFADSGVAVEVNTAGLRKPCAELYPSMPFLRALHAAGVPITIGSDAHCPAEVGFAYTEARAALSGVGYSSALIFHGRQPEEVPL